ncbi:uncharacterized protein LOC144628838 [Oculina patagonica]
MHKSPRKTALLILYLAALQQLVPMVATFYVPRIEKYIIKRRGKSETDLFSVVYSRNSKCPEDVCKSLGATANVFHSMECRCTCKPGYPTFLPELGKCSDTVTVKKTLFKSCSSFFEWPFFLRSLDLEREGYKKGNIEDYHSCHVAQQSAAYYNFQVQNKWVDIHGDIFNIAIEGNQTVFKWKAVKNKELLGRIIRVNITGSCSYSQSDSGPSKTGCLVFKASGHITFFAGVSDNLHGVDYSQSGSSSLIVSPSASSVLLLPSSSPSSVTSPQLSTQTTSILLHPSSSLPSPQPHQTKYVSWTTAIPSLVTSRTLHIEPSESSSAITPLSSSVAVITGNGPGNKDKRSTGDGSNKAVIIGAAGGGTVVLVLLITIIVSYKRRKLRASNNETTTKHEDNDIQLGRTKGNNLTTMSEQDSNPTYQGLVMERGQMNGVALHSSSKDTSYSYDNFTVYQNLDEKAPETSVYQSLKKEQHATGQPDPKQRPRATGHLSNSAKVIAEPRPSGEHLSNRAKVIAEPVYGNGIKLPDTEQGNMPEPLYNVLEESEPEGQYEAPKRDDFGDTQEPLYNVLEESGPEKDYGASESVNHGDTQDPIYNVLEGPEAEENNYEFQDVGSESIGQEPMYMNVLKGPETEQAPQEPLYTALESSDAQNGSQGSRESLYSPLEGSVSDGTANKSSVELTALKLPFYLAAFENPAFDEGLEPDVGYGVVVRKPGPKTTCKRESVYEPLKGPDLYQALRKSTV